MIDRLRIQNFRGLADFSLAGLRGINVLVGGNGVGKTALLEALFLAAGSTPALALGIRAWRGLLLAQFNGSDDLWLDLFRDRDATKAISVSVTDSARGERKLGIFRGEQITSLPLADAVSSPPPLTSAPVPRQSSSVTFEWSEGENTHRITPQFQGGAISWPAPQGWSLKGSFIPANAVIPAAQGASLFSNLSKQNKDEEFTAAMQSVFPDLVSFSVETDMEMPVLYAKTKSTGTRLPLTMISDGMNRLAAILLHTTSAEGGILLVDEIENGFFWKTQETIWRALLKFSETYKTQLFLSTHSLEFLRAAMPVIRERPDLFSLTRLYREDGVSQGSLVSGDDALLLLDGDFEPRV
jgi:energy-coupling factor transporter ATP-binding protein EcfA2